MEQVRSHSPGSQIPHAAGLAPVHLISRWAASNSRSWLENSLPAGVRKGSILLVDDQEDVRELLRFILERKGYQVHTAGDGVQCLRMAKTLRPDLVLLNYLMPVMDGLTALRRLKMNPIISHLRVVMYSGVSDFVGFQSDATDAGALDCLRSPFHVKAFLAVVENALHG